MSLISITPTNNLVIHYLIKNKMKRCLVCDKPIFAKMKNREYCSSKCRSFSKKYTHVCQNCGKIFTNRGKNSKFCSYECRSKVKKIKNKCPICGEIFFSVTNNCVFCSKKCYRISNNNKRRKAYSEGKIIVKRTIYNKICELCNSEYKTKEKHQKFCSKECAGENNKRENNHQWRGGSIHFTSSKEWIKFSEKIRIRDNNTCQICGKKQKDEKYRLSVHHIIPETNIKTRFDLDNLMTVCRSCHTKIHNYRKKQYYYIASPVNFEEEKKEEKE